MKNDAKVETRAASLLCTCLAALAVAWAVVSLTYPFGWDQGIFAWVGEGINQGEMPYRDRWDIKGPLTFYIYALAQALFGHNLWGIRLIDLALVVAAAGMLGIMVSHVTNRIVAGLTVPLFILWYGSGSFWHTAQPDGWAAIAMLFAVVPLVAEKHDLHWSQLLLTGILIGCCILIKPIYITFMVVVLVSLLAHGWTRREQLLLRSGLVLIALCIPLALCAAWFAYRGALQSLVDLWLIYPFTVYSRITSTEALFQSKGFVEYLLSGGVVSVMLPVIGLGIHALWRSNKGTASVMLSWLAVAVFCVILQNRYFMYHWLVIYPAVTFFCAVGFYHLFFIRSDASAPFESMQLHSPLRVVALLLVLALIFHATVHPVFEIMRLVAYASDRMSRDSYYDGFGVPGPEMQAADYIEARTQPTDRLFVWGWSIAIPYLSNRQTVSRFGYSMPLLMGAGTPEREDYRQEALKSLNADPPVYIVVAPQSDAILGRHYELSDFGQLADFMSSRYTEEKRLGDLALYRLIGH
jgi:hypothetical protein